jgi:hypothetical protein
MGRQAARSSYNLIANCEFFYRDIPLRSVDESAASVARNETWI